MWVSIFPKQLLRYSHVPSACLKNQSKISWVWVIRVLDESQRKRKEGRQERRIKQNFRNPFLSRDEIHVTFFFLHNILFSSWRKREEQEFFLNLFLFFMVKFHRFRDFYFHLHHSSPPRSSFFPYIITIV